MHTMTPFPPPEGYWPYIYPPPAFMPPGQEGQASHEGTPNGTSQAPPMLSYYPVAPGYAPFPHFAHPGTGAFSPQNSNSSVSAQPPIDPAVTAKQSEGPVDAGDSQSRTDEAES